MRAKLCALVADGFAQRFAARRRTYPNKEAYIIVHGAGEAIKKISSAGFHDMPEHAGACQIGEGDLSVAYWVNQFPQDNVIVRVLDSDQVPILMLRVHFGGRSAPLYVWLVSAKNDGLPQKEYAYLPHEGHTLIDVLGLNKAVEQDAKIDVPTYVYYIICQQTDYVQKIVKQVNVFKTMKQMEESGQTMIPQVKGSKLLVRDPSKGAIRVTASRAECNKIKITEMFDQWQVKSVDKILIRSSETELRRSFWNLCYWSYGWAGALPDDLKPSPVFGFTEDGFRTSEFGSAQFKTVII